MARACSVCQNELAHLVNVALVSRESYRAISRQYGLSKDALRRHAQEHIPELLVKAREASERSEAGDLLEELRRIGERLERLSDLAEADGDYRTAIGGQGTLLKRVDLLARVRQIIQEAPTVNLYLSPEWIELRAVIVTALDDHPDARESVLRALETASNG
jgi:hypothetical protein